MNSDVNSSRLFARVMKKNTFKANIKFRFFKNTGKFSKEKFAPIMTGRNRQKFVNLVTLESLIWRSLVLFQHENFKNLYYVFEYFSIKYVWPHPKASFPDFNQQRSKPEKICVCTWKAGIPVLQEKYHLCQKEVFRRRVCCHFSLIALIGFICRH